MQPEGLYLSVTYITKKVKTGKKIQTGYFLEEGKIIPYFCFLTHLSTQDIPEHA